MILHQQFHPDEDEEDDDIDESDVDRNREENDDEDGEKRSDKSMECVENSSDEVEDQVEEGTFSSESEDDCEDTAVNGVDGKKVKKLKVDSEKKEVEKSEKVKVNDKIEEEVEINGKNVKDSDNEEEHSDYASDEEGNNLEAIDEVAEANASDIRENEQKASGSRLNDILDSVINSCAVNGNGNSIEQITPPDANWSDSDDDDGKSYNIEEFLRFGARVKAPEVPRKHRYSSNTSVDTSTTSGIGSYNEEHLDAEMGPSDSERTSPGWNPFEIERSVMRKPVQPMDIEEDDEEDEPEDDSPKITLSICMKEDIDCLPLPSALKAYLRYYRN